MSRKDQLTRNEWIAVTIGILGLVLTGGAILAGVIQDGYAAQRIRRQRAIDFGKEWNTTVYDGIVDDDINIVACHQKNASPDQYRKWLAEIATANRSNLNSTLQETFATSNASGDAPLGTIVSNQKTRERLRIRSSLNEFLNFLETMCLAYKYETVDREIMELSSIPAIKHFGRMLQPYMDTLRESHPTLWQAIYDVAELEKLPSNSAKRLSGSLSPENNKSPKPE